MNKSKQPTAKELIDAITKYQVELADNPEVSDTRFRHMEAALYGAKAIIRNIYGLRPVKENAIAR